MNKRHMRRIVVIFEKTDIELNKIIDKFISEVTMEELNEFAEWNEVDIEEATLNYLNEWYFVG